MLIEVGATYSMVNKRQKRECISATCQCHIMASTKKGESSVPTFSLGHFELQSSRFSLLYTSFKGDTYVSVEDFDNAMQKYDTSSENREQTTVLCLTFSFCSKLCA